MYQIIVTGHGRFAEGLTSSIELIVGKQENYHIVNFDSDLSIFKQQMKEIIDKNKNIIIFTDLLGGTPFKTAVELTQEREDCYVLTGTNLGMLFETILIRNNDLTLKEISEKVEKSGKDSVILFQNKIVNLETICEYEDGI